MNPLILYSAAGALLCGLAAGWSIRDWKADADQLAVMEKNERQREELQARYDGLALGYEADRATASQNSTIRQTELRTIYRDLPIRDDCAAPVPAWSLLSDSVREANARAAGEPVGALPSVEPTTSPAQ